MIAQMVVNVGTIDGVLIEVKPAVVEMPIVISVGVVEPHQYAGLQWRLQNHSDWLWWR